MIDNGPPIIVLYTYVTAESRGVRKICPWDKDCRTSSGSHPSVADGREEVGFALMKLVIKNGRVVTARATFGADVVCVNGLITALEDRASTANADRVVDAAGTLVFPGFIDPHVHSRDPGMTEKEDFAHLTRAAAAGGVTTVFDMPNAVPPIANAAIYGARAQTHEKVAQVDFGLWGVSLGRENAGSIPELISEGAVGIKLFWGYSIDQTTKQIVYTTDPTSAGLQPPPTNTEVFNLFKAVSSVDGLLAAHCEDTAIIEANQDALGRPIQDYVDLSRIRSVAAEASAIALGIEYARATHCRFHVLHVSSALGIHHIERAQQEGISVSAETCPHYLILTQDDYASIGSLMKIFPPIRTDDDRAALRRAVSKGVVTSIGSDHAPHTDEERNLAFAAQPAGAIGVETLVRLMLNWISSGYSTYKNLAWVLAEGTARRYRLYPAKGTIQIGSDADFSIVDPDRAWRIRSETFHSKNRLSPWDGYSGRGEPVATIVRGNVVMENGTLASDPIGRLVRSKPVFTEK